MTSKEILDVAQKFLGSDYQEPDPGRYVSEGETRQFRMTDSDLAVSNNHYGRPHVNFEVWEKFLIDQEE